MIEIKEKTKLRKELNSFLFPQKITDISLTIYYNGQWRLMTDNCNIMSSLSNFSEDDEIIYIKDIKNIYYDYDFYNGGKNWISSFFKYSEIMQEKEVKESEKNHLKKIKRVL